LHVEHVKSRIQLAPKMPLPSVDLAVYAFLGNVVVDNLLHLSIPHPLAIGHITRMEPQDKIAC
jgi:hypothetical protein